MLDAERNALRAKKASGSIPPQPVAGASTPADTDCLAAVNVPGYAAITLIRLGQSTWVARFNCRAPRESSAAADPA